LGDREKKQHNNGEKEEKLGDRLLGRWEFFNTVGAGKEKEQKRKERV